MKYALQKMFLILVLAGIVFFAVLTSFTLVNDRPQKSPDIDGLLAFEPKDGEKIVYGHSGRGRELVAWRFGEGENVLVLTFALHGWEDAFPRDGAALVLTANELMGEIPRWNCDEWSIYVLPCCNPDGLLYGVTNDGVGRCTEAMYLPDGSLSRSKGVDINRCFPCGWEKLDEPRYYNGDAPLACPESACLAEFLQTVKGGGMNFCVDVHGWYSQILTSAGKQSALYKVFFTYFPENTWADLNSGNGYLTAYAAVLGYESCLFEFPSGIMGMEDFARSGYSKDFSDAVRLLVNG